VIRELEKRAPTPCPTGHFHQRAWTAVRGHFHDTIAKDIAKFNVSLLVILNAKPTGKTEQQKINMAVALHLGLIDGINYKYKDFEATTWRYYHCWLVLKKTCKFLPPTPPNDMMEEEEEDDGVDEPDPPNPESEENEEDAGVQPLSSDGEDRSMRNTVSDTNSSATNCTRTLLICQRLHLVTAPG
jgi:hypothetical protein